MKINFLLIPVFNQSPIKLWHLKLSLFFFSVILLSCSKGSEEDCEGTFKSYYESDFCKNCETFPGREVKINFMEKDTSIFKFDINDSMVFLFQDSS